jgi:hypothetical protein
LQQSALDSFRFAVGEVALLQHGKLVLACPTRVTEAFCVLPATSALIACDCKVKRREPQLQTSPGVLAIIPPVRSPPELAQRPQQRFGLALDFTTLLAWQQLEESGKTLPQLGNAKAMLFE